jgi:transposase-like protein
MGVKGDKAVKAPLAQRLYADGLCLAEIARRLDVSETSLRAWKEEARIPGEELDGWDKARAQKRGNIARLKDLFERQLAFLEGLRPDEVSAPMMDTLAKLGALVERWDKVETVMRKVAAIEKTAEAAPKHAVVEAIRQLREEYGL